MNRWNLLLATLCVMFLHVADVWADGAEHRATPSESDQALFTRHIPGAQQLEGQILSPCCWDASRQTIDIHGSPIALQLRREIRTRLLAGESVDAIKADLVRRYTEKILAVPPGNPLKEVGVLMSLLFAAAAVGLGAMLVRWRNRSKDGPAQPPKDSGPGGDAAGEDKWDERLDAELRKADT